MAQANLGDLLVTMRQEIAQTIDQTQDTTTQTQIYISDIDIDLPAYIRLEASSESNSPTSRLTIDLPNLRETPTAGRLGRLRVTFAYDKTIDRA